MNPFNFEEHITTYPDFPEKGVLFRDISPVLANPEGLQALVNHMADTFKNYDFDIVCGVDARGLIFASLLAYKLKKGFVMVRKKGKLPGKTITLNYQLEYGQNHLEVQLEAIKPGQKILIIDDVLATGGTAQATAELIETIQGQVVALGFIIELKDLCGRQVLRKYPVHTIVAY